MYHSRLAKYCNYKLIQKIIERLEKYFDNIYIDEIQDFSGHDFNFILQIFKCNCNIWGVGDFNQHTYNTSNDGSVNKNLYNNYEKYVHILENANSEIKIDNSSFLKSKRCSNDVCQFIKQNLNIEIDSYENNHSKVCEIIDEDNVDIVVSDNNIVKLFYQNSNKYNIENVDNWGNSKGDTYKDVCVILNPNSYKAFKNKKLYELLPLTRNKLYVACSRPTNNLYFIEETKLKKYKIED